MAGKASSVDCAGQPTPTGSRTHSFTTQVLQPAHLLPQIFSSVLLLTRTARSQESFRYARIMAGGRDGKVSASALSVMDARCPCKWRAVDIVGNNRSLVTALVTITMYL